jgi:hypothetical protein
MATAAHTQLITVGVDGSAVSQVAVDWAARAAALRSVPLKVVHQFFKQLIGNFGLNPLIHGSPVDFRINRWTLDDVTLFCRSPGACTRLDEQCSVFA